MKKNVLIAIIFVLAFVGCDLFDNKTTLTIKNESSYEITHVLWNNVSFTSSNTENSIKPGTSVTMDVEAGSGYVRFKIVNNLINARSSQIIAVEKRNHADFVFIDNTLIVEEGNLNNHGTLFDLAGILENSGVSFRSFSPPSIFVENQSNERLIAFKDNLSPSTLLSGIPANVSNHGLRHDPVLFASSGTFILVLITESQYITNRNDLEVLNDHVFAKLPVSYSTSGNNSIFRISPSLGGAGRINIVNPTNFFVVFRKDGPSGDILGFARPYDYGNFINLQVPGDYEIYPQIRFYNPFIEVITTIYPTFNSGYLNGRPYFWPLSLGTNNLTHTINLNDLAHLAIHLTTGGAHLRIINNSNTAVNILNGTANLTNMAGLQNVAPGTISETFFLAFPFNPDFTYPSLLDFPNLSIGSGSNMIKLGPNLVELDNVYSIEVTGGNAANLQLGTITHEGRINVEDFLQFF